jgi:hypothetical protein
LKGAARGLSQFGIAVGTGTDYSLRIYEGYRDSLDYDIGKTLKANLDYDKKKVIFYGLVGSYNSQMDDDSREYYNLAKGDYGEVVDDYSNTESIDKSENNVLDIEDDDEILNGEIALYKEILLANSLGQKKDVLEFCEEFSSKYPDSKKDISIYCLDEIRLSSTEISTKELSIDREVKRISFKGINEPSFEQLGAVVSVHGTKGFDGTYELMRGERVYLSDSEFFYVDRIEEDSVVIKASVRNTNDSVGDFLGYIIQSPRIKLNSYAYVGFSKYEIRLKQINAEKVASVSVISNINRQGSNIT